MSMLRGLVALALCASLAVTFKFEGKNILAIGMLEGKLDLVTKSLSVYKLDKWSLPKEVDVNASSKDMSSVWPGLAAEQRLQICKTKDCKFWLQSGETESIFFSTPDMNGTMRYDVKSQKLMESDTLPLTPYTLMLSSDQPDAMYMVVRKLDGIMFHVVQYSAENNTMEVNDSRLMCEYPDQHRVQFSHDIFHTPCSVKSDWGPIVGFVADDTFYLLGNDSKVRIFESSVYQAPAAKLRTVPYAEFVTEPSGLSTVAIILIVLVTVTIAFVVLIAVCCFLRKKKIIGNKDKGSTGKGAGAKRSRSHGSHRKTKGSKSKSRKKSSLKSKRRSSLKSKKRRSSLKNRKASSAKKSSRISPAKSRKLSAAKSAKPSSAKLGKRSSVMSKKRSSALKTRSLVKSHRVSSGKNVQSRRSLKRNTMASLKASNVHTRRSSRSQKKSSRLTSVQSKRASASKLKTSKRSSRASSRKSSRASSRKSSKTSSKRR